MPHPTGLGSVFFKCTHDWRFANVAGIVWTYPRGKFTNTPAWAPREPPAFIAGRFLIYSGVCATRTRRFKFGRILNERDHLPATQIVRSISYFPILIYPLIFLRIIFIMNAQCTLWVWPAQITTGLQHPTTELDICGLGSESRRRSVRLDLSTVGVALGVLWRSVGLFRPVRLSLILSSHHWSLLPDPPNTGDKG